jgi:hypothetical protein|tara:strand:+ start:945 stop:1499 length:555 start_codon:yes stop_codon:yes gene_type:complete
MINTKNINKDKKMGLTPDERKSKVAKLREEHEDYFQAEWKGNALYIPKMAYRPKGKDELHVSFFPSELEKEENIYTEFVSIDYDSEDPKRTLYLHKYNPHWKSEYELITSSSGFQRHLIPVSELKVINDVTNRKNVKAVISNPIPFEDLTGPDPISIESAMVNKLEDINQSIITLTKVITKLIK